MKKRPIVLLIDDTPDNLEIYSQYLLFHGVGVLSESTGEAGLATAFSVRPNAIVLDLGLPKMDGWEVAARLKADPRTKDICLVVLSGHVFPDSQARAMQAGADAFLMKPCAPADVLSELQRRCGW
jgi:CheY-like chemotaxis protein